jgi:uncharacterized protein (DUF433 family)
MVDWTLHIESHPNKLFGKPIIAGARIPVDLLLEKYANGDTIEELLDAHPTITKEDLTACFLYPNELERNFSVFTIKGLRTKIRK